MSRPFPVAFRPLVVLLISGTLVLMLPRTTSSAQSLSSGAQREIAEGVQLLRDGQTAQAMNRFNAALELMPDSPEALTWRGICGNQAQQYKNAAADFRAVLRSHPASAAARYNLALSLIGLEESDSAIEQLRLVVVAQPASVQALYNLAVLLERKGSLAEAADHLEAAHTLAPADGEITLHLFRDALTLNEKQRLSSLRSTLSTETTAPAIQRQAASVLLERGRFAEAVPLLRSAYRREPAEPGQDLLLARLLLVTDQPGEARSVLTAAQPSKPEDDALRQTLLGAALAALREIPEAIVVLGKALEDDPKLALAQNILGFCLFQQGQYSMAAAAYGNASELEPRRLRYAEDAARAFQRANETMQAIHFAQRATALDGANALDFALLGKLYAASGHSEEAIRELRQAAQSNPQLESAVYLLARTYMQMGNQREAEEWGSKLNVLKQRHTAEFDLQKKAIATSVHSSTLLQGGTMSDGETGTVP